jgi:hypothetical protein
MRTIRLTAAVAATMMSSALLVGCSSAKAPVCDSFAALQHSVDDLRTRTMSENGVGALQSDLATVRTNLNTFVADARQQFQPQVAGVQQASDQVSSAVDTAKADPTAASLRTVATALAGLADSVRSLGTEVKGTC